MINLNNLREQAYKTACTAKNTNKKKNLAVYRSTAKTVMNILAKLKERFNKKVYYGVIIYDGYKHYISSNIFTSHREAKRWKKTYNTSAISAQAVEIVKYKTSTRLINRV